MKESVLVFITLVYSTQSHQNEEASGIFGFVETSFLGSPRVDTRSHPLPVKYRLVGTFKSLKASLLAMFTPEREGTYPSINAPYDVYSEPLIPEGNTI